MNIKPPRHRFGFSLAWGWQNYIENNQKKIELEKENLELKSKLNFLKDNFEKNLKENQESSTFKEEQIKILQQEVIDAKDQSNHTHDDFYQKSEIEMKLQEQADWIEALEVEKDSMKKKNEDLNDELTTKNKEVQDLESQIVLKSSKSLLSEELAQVGMFKCDQCNFYFENEAELKNHNVATHEVVINGKLNLLEKMSHLERTVSQQKLNLTTSLLNLKKNESKESHVCKCKTYCRINHQKHNYIRSKSDEIAQVIINCIYICAKSSKT